ncbi:hypothetical protein VP01_3992g2 [Puccinia sorghi]|uniref:Tc1-like transposase DDE domain-containing protein n=1 Tax=Puccinia sorghi TaxID=27349 RepID=A0A0L6UU31_9BASI|nr:hypothetical protein VP01_3992g2 [Puccinia sorghi]
MDSLQPHLNGEIKKSIEKEIFKNGTKQVNVSKKFGISNRQLTIDVITLVMLILEETPSTTLKKLAEHVKNKFDIQVSPGAIQKTLKNIKLFFKSSDQYWESSNLENKCKREPDQSYWCNMEKKKTGTTSIYICKFLVCLQDHCPAQSIIIMDNTRIHGRDNFQQVKNLLKESTKKINIEFLPKYSLLLNKIELALNIIMTQIKYKEIKSQSKMAEGILQAIRIKMTPEICSKSFQHCKKFYSSCTHMQPIMV